MVKQAHKLADNVDDIYQETSAWHVNVGGIKIVAKRLTGRFRQLKWLGMSVWLIFFLGPYLRYNGEQAVLFDLPHRQFNIFAITVYPQDIWMLSLVLLFFAILLAVVTSIAGRVFCGYFCFQTVWTDIYTLIEAKLEGNTPQKAMKFSQAPWSWDKIMRKTSKHVLWLLIAVLTGVSFVAWFTDAFDLWQRIVYFDISLVEAAFIFAFTAGTYVFAGFMREQVCFWLCPYAKLQGVMYDQDTTLPAYDAERGEPRGKIKKDQDRDKGSCVDCHLCVAVCPTGIDIRHGQQSGCITCGLCIDACDTVMDKIGEPRGLIRYASYKNLHHRTNVVPIYKRFRVIVYSLILLVSVAGIVYGFVNLSPTEFKIVHERQPLFVRLSDGTIQNKYTIRLLNKTKETMQIRFDIEGIKGAILHGLEPLIVQPGKVASASAWVRISEAQLPDDVAPIVFVGEVISHPSISLKYESMFIVPSQP